MKTLHYLKKHQILLPRHQTSHHRSTSSSLPPTFLPGMTRTPNASSSPNSAAVPPKATFAARCGESCSIERWGTATARGWLQCGWSGCWPSALFSSAMAANKPDVQPPFQSFLYTLDLLLHTSTGVLYVTHSGYRCPDESCPGRAIMHRSAQADALALPGFTFGLDVLLLAGTLRLGEHRTLDEVHWALLYRLGELGVSISRREVAYLIETYGALLRAGSEVGTDEPWLAEVREQGGMLLSIDGIQPDKGNETV